MNFDDPEQRAVFFDVHHGLPREGPGNRSALLRALEIAGFSDPATAPSTVLDIGCGPGQQTLYLAEALPGARIIAVDNHPDFIDDLSSRVAAAGFSDRVEGRVGDMTALDFEAGSFDLIWCEGAAYCMGFRAALAAWKPLLSQEGRLALSEAVWLKNDPPEPLRQFWQEYPAMRDLPTRREHIEETGYELLGDFVLPAEAWWESYYSPMEARLAELAAKYEGNVPSPLGSARGDNAKAQQVLAECEEEIEIRRRYPDFYNYAFFVMRPAAAGS